MIFLHRPSVDNNVNAAEEPYANLFGCAFQGLGKEGRKKCRSENTKNKQEQAGADADLTAAAAAALMEKDVAPTGGNDTGMSATPFIIGGAVLVLALGVFVVIKMRQK